MASISGALRMKQACNWLEYYGCACTSVRIRVALMHRHNDRSCQTQTAVKDAGEVHTEI